MSVLISFDLDNTLYDNTPVLARAEQACLAQINRLREDAGQTPLSHADWYAFRRSEKQADPIACEDLSELRRRCIRKALPAADAGQVEQQITQIMDEFILLRSQIQLPAAIEKMLQRLAEEYPLVAVTNGNVNFSGLSWSHYFTGYYSPALGYRAKPHPEMLLQAARDRRISPQQLVHIGDSEEFDAVAAKRAGCHFLYFLPFVQGESNIEQNCRALAEKLTILLHN